MGGGGLGRGVSGWGDQAECKRRIELFGKIHQKKIGVRVGLGGCQGGCERRIEVFVKIQKKWGGGVGWERVGMGVGLGGSGWGGVRVDVNEELKFL